MRLAGNWPGCRPAGTAVLADAATIRDRARDKFVGALVVQQMQAADLLALNKLDLLPEGDVPALRAWVQAQAAPADLVEARFAQVDPARLLGIVGAGPAHRQSGDTGGHSSPRTRPVLGRLATGRPGRFPAPSKACSPAGRTSIAPRAFVDTGAGLRRIDWSGGRLDLSPALPGPPQLVLIGPFDAAARQALLRALDACAEPAGCTGRFAG